MKNLIFALFTVLLFSCQKENIAPLKEKGAITPIDSTFDVLGFINDGSEFNNTVIASAVQSNGKFLFAGDFTSYNGNSFSKIIRLDSINYIDSSFIIGSGFNGSVTVLTLQADGKILAGGGFTSYNGFTASRIIRLNTDGSVDNTFNSGTGFDIGYVYAVSIQSDGKILIGGQFNSYNGIFSNKIVRLNSNGSIDNSFITGDGAGGTIESICIQPDNKILVGGAFTSYNGTFPSYIIRLEPDGSIDASFVSGSGFSGSRLHDIKLQADNKILIAGSFSFYNGVAAEGIIRLNTDGSIDNTFLGFSIGSDVLTLKIQPDGKILAGGNFSSYNSVSASSIVRLETDGSIDASFVYGTGANSQVHTIGLSGNNVIYLAGGFNLYNGITTNYIVDL